jgi:hypothetical protein
MVHNEENLSHSPCQQPLLKALIHQMMESGLSRSGSCFFGERV